MISSSQGMQAKLKEAERRLGTLTARKKAADVRAKIAQSQSAFKTDLEQDAFDKLDRLSQKVERAEAEAEAMSELSRSERAESLEDEPVDTSGPDVDIEAELMQLKKESKGSTD